MTVVGIEAMNAFAGSAYIDVEKLARHRKLDMTRFSNLLMRQKTVPLPYEDPVTFGLNAARPLIDAMSAEEKDRIEMVITCTESAFDFGKSMSTYFHKHLGLNRNCRLFELKNACYSGVAGLQMAVNFVLSQASPGAKALVIATDVSRFMTVEAGEALTEDWSFNEPSGGAGAVAMIVSEQPYVFQIDVGANGYYGYEVMDTCRPIRTAMPAIPIFRCSPISTVARTPSASIRSASMERTSPPRSDTWPCTRRSAAWSKAPIAT